MKPTFLGYPPDHSQYREDDTVSRNVARGEVYRRRDRVLFVPIREMKRGTVMLAGHSKKCTHGF